MSKILSGVITFCLALCVDFCLADEIKPPRMLVSSFTKGTAFIITPDGTVEWEYKMPGLCQDAWMLPGGDVVLTGFSCVRRVTRDKKIVWEYKSPKDVGKTEIHSCHALADGGVVFTECGTSRLIELDANGAIAKQIVLKELKNNHHTFSRQIRKLANGNYLVVATGDGKVCELNPDGKIIRQVTSKEMAAQGVRWVSVHAAVKLDNGNLMISGGHVASLAEVDKDNRVVWSFTAADAPAELGLKYTAGFQILADGKIVISAFDSKTKLYAIDKASKKVVWKMENGNIIGNPTHVLVLDGSETNITQLLR